MSHAPKNIHWRLEPVGEPFTLSPEHIRLCAKQHAGSYDCASGCIANPTCPPGRCVNAGGLVSDAPRGEREGSEVMAQARAAVFPMEVVAGTQRPMRSHCTAEGPKADGAFVCDCMPGECPGFVTASPAITITRLAYPQSNAVRPADYPECSGDPASCPENEGHGCCTPNQDRAAGVPPGWKLVPETITEQMHAAAAKVLIRASGLDGTPQRMLDAMLAAAPIPPAALLPAERECCGTFEGSEHRATCKTARDWQDVVHTLLGHAEFLRAEGKTEMPQWFDALAEKIARAPAEREALTDAARDVLAERSRQVEAEGWTPEHDDEHRDHSMAIAAACYSLADVRAALAVETVRVDELWLWTGWDSSWFKPKDKRRNMVRAAALLLAEIERIDRAAMAQRAEG